MRTIRGGIAVSMSGDYSAYRNPKGIFYGWWVVLASMSALLLGSAFYWQGFGVFFLALQDEFSTNRAALSGVISLSQLEGGMLGPVGGYLVDRFGPRRMMAIGVSLMGIGYLLMSLVDSLFVFYVVFLGVISVGMSIGIRVPAVVAPANWFIKRRGLAIGIALTGSGFGGFFIPVIGYLIATQGWRQTAVFIGVAVWVLGIPLAMVMRRRPEDYGLLPDGDKSQEVLLGKGEYQDGSIDLQQELVVPDFTLKAALRMRVFWFLAFAFGMRQFAVGAISLHQVPFLVDTGRSLEMASAILATVTITSILGRLGFGWLADKFQPRFVMAASMFLVSLGALILTYVGDGWLLLVLFILVYSIGWGGGATTMNATRGAYFGRTSFGTISGTMDLVQMFGLVLGPVYAGFIFDLTNSYSIAFSSFAVAAGLAAIIMLFLRAPVHEDLGPAR